MSSSNPPPVISVENLGKEYVLGGEDISYESFREMLLQLIIAPVRRFKTLARKSDDAPRFWALKDVSFSVDKGEVVGIIGKNGAGKSTLLKVLSRITAPTEGEVTYRGRVASLLEVGTGFHPEFTGKENIYLNGSILGMSRTEVDERLDDIAAFAGVEKFLDTPVKRYSSGMYVRLAFAVAAHMDPDILIVDEVLAVGDAEFQKKCLTKLGEVSRGGRTVLFVSHNMNSIRTLCSRAICMVDGEIRFDGPPQQVIGEYLRSTRLEQSDWSDSTGDQVKCNYLKSIKIRDKNGVSTNVLDYDSPVILDIEYTVPETKNYMVAARVTDASGNILFTSWDTDFLKRPPVQAGSKQKTTCTITSNLLRPGEYTLTILLRKFTASDSPDELDLSLTITESGCPVQKGRVGLIAPNLEWRLETE